MRTVTGIGGRQNGMRAIRTASSICIRSTKPAVQGQEYLDLYVLQRDRARWGALKDRADEMIRCIDKALTRLGLGRRRLRPPTSTGRGQARRPAIVIGSQSKAARVPGLPRGRSEKVA